jgi:hypothetical protein
MSDDYDPTADFARSIDECYRAIRERVQAGGPGWGGWRGGEIMTAPLRPFLLNEQIGLEARRIAHRHTLACGGDGLPNVDEHHTCDCNALKLEIQTLALAVKLAGMLRPAAECEGALV